MEGFVFIIFVPCWNDNRCPRKSGVSSLYYCLLCLPLCRNRSLSFLLKPSRWLPCWEKASHSGLRVCCRKMFCCVLCIFFPTRWKPKWLFNVKQKKTLENSCSFGLRYVSWYKKVQVGKDQEKAQSEKDSHSKNRGGISTLLLVCFFPTSVFGVGIFF